MVIRTLFSLFLLITLFASNGCNKPSANSSSTAADTPQQPDPNIPPPRSPAEKTAVRLTIPAMKTMDDFEKIRTIFYEHQQQGMDMVSLMQQAAEPAIDNPTVFLMYYPEFKKDEVFQKIKDAGFPEITEGSVR